MRIVIDGMTYFEIRGKPDAAATISSNLKIEDADCPEDIAWNHQVDAIESLVLAHYCAGVDVAADAYRRGLHTALEATGNNV